MPDRGPFNNSYRLVGTSSWRATPSVPVRSAPAYFLREWEYKRDKTRCYAPARFEMDLRAFNCHLTSTMNIAQGFQCLLDGHRLALRSVRSCVRKTRGWSFVG
jgi:hypothetical protein